jgi:hypothetical protein
VDHREEDIPRVAAVAEIEADRDHTAGNQRPDYGSLHDEEKARWFSGLFLFVTDANFSDRSKPANFIGDAPAVSSALR